MVTLLTEMVLRVCWLFRCSCKWLHNVVHRHRTDTDRNVILIILYSIQCYALHLMIV